MDIGAHVGIFSVYAAYRSETGKVYAFEPFIENYTRLVAHRDLNHRNNLIPFSSNLCPNGKWKLKP